MAGGYVKVLLDVTETQQQVQMAQDDALDLHQGFLVDRRRKCEIRSREELHEQKHQQMYGFLIGFLQINDPMQASG